MERRISSSPSAETRCESGGGGSSIYSEKYSKISKSTTTNKTNGHCCNGNGTVVGIGNGKILIGSGDTDFFLSKDKRVKTNGHINGTNGIVTNGHVTVHKEEEVKEEEESRNGYSIAVAAEEAAREAGATLGSEDAAVVAGRKLPKGKRRQAGESYEEASLWDAFSTYMCYFFLVLVGYVNDIIRPRTTKEKNRTDYVPLYASFESFYTRHVYRRVRDCWNIPVASVPGKYITLVERQSRDYGWTFEMTGKKVNCINMGSYNYLGFAENHGACAEAAIKSIKEHGITTCSTRKELGNATYHNELDQLVAKFVGTEDAITCAMGFATNTLNLPAILNKGCLVISDAKNHASIILGLRLSEATIRVFKHNNMKSLEKRLRDAIVNGQPRTHLAWDKIFIVVEGVYSMEGSIARLPELIALKQKYGAYLYLDEAHSIGAMGPNGRGVVDYWDCDPKDVDVLMGTFTKSFGSAGGYIAGSRELIQMLRSNSHAQFYGTAMSPPIAQQILSSMKIIMGEDGTNEGVKRIHQLARNSRYFRMKLKQAGFIVYGNDDSPVVPTALYMPTKIGYTVREMVKRGVATVGVGFPATPLVEGRTRFCISSSHTKEMLDHAYEAMCEVGHNIMIRNSRLPRPKGEILFEEEPERAEQENELD